MIAILLAFALQVIPPIEEEPGGSGVLIVLLDDVGAEHLSFHPMGIEAGAPAPTPNLDALAASGVQFVAAWANPKCSPTRASVLTGRFPFRTGVGDIVTPPAGYELPASEVTLAERMVDRGHSAALIGKWHLDLDPEGPCSQGFQVWDGAQRNLNIGPCGGPCSYFDWERTQDTPTVTAVQFQETGYATTVQADAARGWIQGEQAAGRSWCCVVGFSAAHIPRHAPPLALQPVTGATSGSDALTMHRGMIEALDTELGGLLAGLDLERCTVFVVGDNGSADAVATPPVLSGRAKDSVYRGGVEVPFLVAGQYVQRAINVGKNAAGEQIPGPVNVVDIFRTALFLLPGQQGGPWPSQDGLNLYRQGQWTTAREWNFTERFEPLGAPAGGPYTNLDRAVEEDGWKLILDESGIVGLYDVQADPWELVNVLADGTDPGEQATLDGLLGRLAGMGL